MGSAHPKAAPAVIEPVYCSPISVDGIARISRLPGDRFQFDLFQETVGDGGMVEHVVVVRMICPLGVIPSGLRQVSHAIADASLELLGTAIMM